MKSLLLLSVALGTVGQTVVGPDAELRAALVDLTTHVSAELSSETRYLSFFHLAPERRAEAAAVASFVLNSVSRADVIVRPIAVPNTDDRLWRFRLSDYGLPHESWEALASQDPYWHLRTQVVEPTTKHGASEKIVTVYTDGGWLDLSAAAELRAASHSGGALVRGDFFIERASTTLDGGLYYELAGIADDESAFFRSIGLDLPTIDELRADQGANVLRSRVTFKPRRVVRRQGPLGGAWHTYDTAAVTPERDPLRNPFDFVYDAGEHIVAKRNGLHLYALFNREGKRQDAVPDVIAKDLADLHGAGIVAPLISCVRCHVEDGLRPVANDQRRLLAAGVELFVESPTDAQRLAAFYLSDLDRKLTRDREDFADAVAAATGGLDGAATSAALARAVRDYHDEPVDAARAAAELGVARDRLVASLQATRDPILAALVVGIDVQRRQWEASFGEAALLVRGATLNTAGEQDE